MQTETIQITSELLALISEVDEFKGAWRALGTLAPERLKALRHVATIESIGSSTRIEGEMEMGSVCIIFHFYLNQLMASSLWMELMKKGQSRMALS